MRKLFAPALLVALTIVFTLYNGNFLTLRNLLTILQQMVVTLIAAYGMLYVIVEGGIDLSVGSVIALSAIAVANTVGTLGIFAIIPAIIVGLLCGLVNGLVSTYLKVPTFIVTMATQTSFRGIILILTGGAQIMITRQDFLTVYGGRSIGNVPNSIIFGIIVTIIIWYVFKNFAFSREVRAVGGSEKVATLAGIKVNSVKVKAFVLAGGLAGLAGCLQAARSYAATPTMGEGLEMDIIAAVVLGGTPMSGGIGSVMTTVLGALIIVVLSNGMNMMGLPADVQKVAKGVMLIVAVCATIDRRRIGIIK
ncbi:MAG: ABC transporter permease [Oscillospiraceae bacterium]|nr:ABC transporter permease [Oscillospiraceae bacterium]